MANNTSFQKPENIAELVEEYIHKHYMELLELGEIAEKFGFSVSYLTKIFTKFTGKTPSKYIRDYRISLAKQLLRNPNLSISVVGKKVGYPDQFHFSKIFRQATGMSLSLIHIWFPAVPHPGCGRLHLRCRSINTKPLPHGPLARSVPE